MPRKFYKHKLLLDEGIAYRIRFPILNHRFDVKHIKGDLNCIGLSDADIYSLAIKQGRIIVTYNEKDFRELANISKQTGVIGLTTNLTYDQIDKRLTALLNRSTKSSLFGKLTLIPGSSENP